MTRKERFVILARYFLEGFNPRLDFEVVVLDAILALPEEKIDHADSMRHLAHGFVHDCLTAKRKEEAKRTTKDIQVWLNDWWGEHGV